MKTRLKNLVMAVMAGAIITGAAVFAVTPAMAQGYDVGMVGQVVGVEWWDHLNVRRWPASHSQKIGELAPRSQVWVERCIAVADSSDWCLVHTQPLSGWVNSRFLAPVQSH